MNSTQTENQEGGEGKVSLPPPISRGLMGMVRAELRVKASDIMCSPLTTSEETEENLMFHPPCLWLGDLTG